MNKLLRGSVLAAAFVAIAAGSALAQTTREKNNSLACREGDWYNDRLVSSCQIREQTIPASGGQLSVDGRQNGGVSVKGWDQNQILVRARVQTAGLSLPEAEQLAAQIRIETGGNRIFASGPETNKNSHWNVSYEVFVPRRSDVSVETHNGGVSIADVNGRIDFSAMNGGVVLRRVGGTVRGSTTNGGLVVDLTGDRWEGESLDVSTTNGGVVMSVPENYSANIETGTVNGRVEVDFPVTVQGNITKRLSFNLGSGGAPVRAMTTNGGVRIQRVGVRQ
jgi:DUF4097 and DUF4098 domain-containing protein YvlB